MDRREFLGAMTAAFVRLQGHAILETIEPVVGRARHVRIHDERIEDVAAWMAYEALAWPDFKSPLDPAGSDADIADFVFLTSTINFAFTDFAKHVMFKTSYQGHEYSDSDAMVACLKRAHEGGTPILEGSYLQSLERRDLERLFAGNIEMPMLGERLSIFREVGKTLTSSYGGRFHRFLASGPRRVYAEERGLLDRLLEAFPSFRDESMYRGGRVRFEKRAQLLLWQLHARFRESGFFALEDPAAITIFADYIVPVALRLLGITSYTPELERAIQERRLIPRDSEEEVEIRAASIWACQLLTGAINRLRPADRQVIDPVVDGRLWTHYHETHWPHHLTVTTAY